MLRRIPALLTPLICAAVLIGCPQANRQPTLDPIATQEVHVGETLRLELTARDPDGDALVFKATPRPATAEFEPTETGALFVWPPLISDTGPTGKVHDITITVEDGGGGLAARTVRINVLPQETAPLFVGPSGYVLNLSEDDDISFTVAVSDDDSAEVQMRIVGDCDACPEGHSCRDGSCQIDGSRFQRIDSKTASFYWRPSKSQRELGNYWQVVVGAKDETHDEVAREFSILLMNSDAEKNCPGTPPVFVTCDDPSCVPLADLSGVGALVFQGQGIDFESEIREMTLHFANNNPLDPASYEGNSVTMDRCHPDDDPGCPADPQERYFTGVFPNPASSSSQPLLLHYYLTATDNDDIKGTGCDHVTRFPKEGHFTLATYPTGWVGCKDDGLENNDELATAVTLEPGVTYDLRMCSEACTETDWWKIDAQPGAIVGVELLHDPTQGGLQVTLHDATGAQVAPLPGEDPTTRVVISPETSPVYAQIKCPPGAKPGDQTYGVVVSRTFGGCPNDQYEPNDSLETAPTLLSASVKSLTTDTVICPADRDFIAVPAWPAESIVVDLDFQHSFGDLDLRLYDADGKLVARSETATSSERVVWHVQEADTYTIEVFGYNGQVNTGRLAVDVVPTATLCFEDNLAPNQHAATATLLPENVYFDLLVCSGKEDWFRVDVNAGETLQIVAQPFWPDGAELEIVAFDDDDGKQILGNAIEPDAPGQARWVANRPEAGPIRWQVRTKDQFTTAYDMAFGVADPPGECLDDRFSPTNTVKSALDVDSEAGFVTRLKICPGGEDWFRIQGEAFEELFVFVFGFPNEEPLKASLHRFDGPDLLHVMDGEQTSNGVAIVHLPEDNHEFYIHVQGVPGALHHYDLVMFIE